MLRKIPFLMSNWIQFGSIFNPKTSPMNQNIQKSRENNSPQTLLVPVCTNFDAFWCPGPLFKEIYIDFYEFGSFFSTRNLRFRNTLYAKRLFFGSCFSLRIYIFSHCWHHFELRCAIQWQSAEVGRPVIAMTGRRANPLQRMQCRKRYPNVNS